MKEHIHIIGDGGLYNVCYVPWCTKMITFSVMYTTQIDMNRTVYTILMISSRMQACNYT